jgi:hypothetical protein
MTAAVVSSLWLGPVQSEGRAAYHRAREAGLSPMRALVLGTVGSFRDCWAFRSKIAAHVGCSVRTVARALAQARQEGLVGVARCKQGEKPPNWGQVVPCGWSHRWIVGWGKVGDAVKQAVNAARARWIVHAMVKASPAPTHPKSTPSNAPRRHWTAAELDAELDRRELQNAERKRPPPD